MFRIRFASLFLVIFLTSLGFSACRAKTNTTTTTKAPEIVQLTYYRLFDDEDVFSPFIQEFQAQNPTIQITYKEFTDASEYEEMIVNEMAEGVGPDLFTIHNSWINKHWKKLTPMPSELMTPSEFEETFVNVAYDDFVRDDADGVTQIYGLPLYIDTLGLYYNQDQFEDKIPSRGKPATTWDELKEDVFKLTKRDNSFERFELAGVALGRADNILRAIDILYMMMLQYDTIFYNERGTEGTFADQQGVDSSGRAKYPAAQALELYTSFGLPSNKSYSWNSSIADADSEQKELLPFVHGKVSMIFGYSYTYQQILDLIAAEKARGESVIATNAVKTAEVPQVEDPATSTDKRDAFASYFAETVSRTSEHPEEAWAFLQFITDTENAQYYYEQTHRPSARRDLIDEQSQEPIYGTFASQVGYAESLSMSDPAEYELIFSEAIENVLGAKKSVGDAMRVAQEAVTLLLPTKGLFPVVTTTSTTTQ